MMWVLDQDEMGGGGGVRVLYLMMVGIHVHGVFFHVKFNDIQRIILI